MIDYQIAKLELQKFKTTDTIATAHGLLCGYACVNTEIKLENWLFEILEEYDKDDDFSVLASVFNQSLDELSDPALNFNLLIENDENLRLQVIDVKEWCGGFLVGLGLAKVQTSDDEILEIIKNINEISQIDSNIPDNDESIDDLTEIIEFVRIGVLLIQETLNPSKQDFVNPQVLH